MKVQALISQLNGGITRALMQQIFNHSKLTISNAMQVLQTVRRNNLQCCEYYSLYLSFLARKNKQTKIMNGIKMAESEGISATDQWNGVHMQLHATRRELNNTVNIISSSLASKYEIIPCDFAYCLKKLGTTTEAVVQLSELWKQYNNKDNGVICALIRSLIGTGTEAKAEELYSMIPNNNKMNAINIFIAHAAARGDKARIQHWLLEMEKHGLRPHFATFTPLIALAGRQGDKAAVLHWLEEMKHANLKPNVITFSTLVSYAFKHNDEQEAFYWVREMETYGYKIPLHTYKDLIDHAAHKGDKANVKHWLSEMLQAGFKPNMEWIKKHGLEEQLNKRK